MQYGCVTASQQNSTSKLQPTGCAVNKPHVAVSYRAYLHLKACERRKTHKTHSRAMHAATYATMRALARLSRFSSSHAGEDFGRSATLSVRRIHEYSLRRRPTETTEDSCRSAAHWNAIHETELLRQPERIDRLSKREREIEYDRERESKLLIVQNYLASRRDKFQHSLSGVGDSRATAGPAPLIPSCVERWPALRRAWCMSALWRETAPQRQCVFT